MTNRKTGLPMPLFLLTLPKNMINKDIFNMTELCYLKIKVEPLRPKIGPAQCFRCQGIFPLVQILHEESEMRQVRSAHLTRNCTKTSATEATCCNCQGNHPANFTGCPRNPLNKPPPPPKVNFWEERARKRRELQEAAKAQADAARAATTSAPAYTPPTSESSPSKLYHSPTSEYSPCKHSHSPTSECSSSPRPRPTPTPSTQAINSTHLQPTFNHRRNTQAAASTAGNLGPDLLKIFRNRPQCIIVGDFNAKHTSWSATPHNNSAGNTIVRLVRANGFLLTAPNGPTRVHTRGRPSTIDFGITCGINDITAEVHSDLSSDHNPVHFVISINSSIPFKQNCKTLTNCQQVQAYPSLYIQYPLPNPTQNPRKNRLRKLWQRTQYPPLKAEVNRLQRIIRTELKNSKEHVWDSLQKDANIDTDTLHKLVAGNNSNNNIIYPPILSSRGLVFGTKEKADCFVDNLEESFTENRTPYDDDHIDKVDRTIRRFLNNYSSSIPPLTSPQEICDIISKLNIRKAPGHDQIKNIALKSLPMNAITHLTKIFNKCLLLQHFPQIWKHCTISPPEKNKDPKFPLNYRPISLISCVAKLFEKILLSRIQAFSDSNHIIPDFQHGFRKRLQRATNLIIDGFNTHRTTGGIFLDVEKAFDRVWHNGLIFKLIQINLPPYLIKIIYEYLSNRTFQVKINSIHSRIGSIQAGTPQGSILSPLLYSLYTYDFPTSPTVEVCLFADDAAILSQARSPEIVRKNLQSYLIKLKNGSPYGEFRSTPQSLKLSFLRKGITKTSSTHLNYFETTSPGATKSNISASHLTRNSPIETTYFRPQRNSS
ncbi:probable RNA-directed DNA polymerase from transposon X-element [Trichonephila clavipes]|nr:probable RNA-directed DNA polymerase from transposon X-element [Trichonephila clavipes]